MANAEGRLQGRAEFGLSPKGRAQAQRLSERFQREGFQPAYVYSSPQQRAAETAQIVARPWNVSIVHLDDLREHDVGIFTRLTWPEIDEKYPDLSRRFQESGDWDIVEGAETLRERQARAHRVIETAIQRHANDDVVLLFTHGGILQHMLAALIGSDRTWGVSVAHTAVFEFTLDPEHWSLDGHALLNNSLWRIDRFNDASHLAGPLGAQ